MNTEYWFIIDLNTENEYLGSKIRLLNSEYEYTIHIQTTTEYWIPPSLGIHGEYEYWILVCNLKVHKYHNSSVIIKCEELKQAKKMNDWV